ncbi:MAG: hypothetical protein ACRDTI_06640 [Mycobacterium sp.]
MSVSTDLHPELQWDMADRLRKTLRIYEVSVQEMASYLEVNRNTVGAWLNGRNEPRKRDVRLWALRIGRPDLVDWLFDGTEPGDPGGGPQGEGASTRQIELMQ